MMGMAWRAASLLLVAAIFVGHVQATWKWENNSTHRPASASSVVTSSSSISTSSSSSVSIGPQHDLLVVPTTLVHSETSGQDGLPHTEQEGRRPTQKSSRALEDDPSDAGTRDLEAAPSDTEPRFIGRLKKKLCSVGLGFNCGHKVYKPAAQHYGKPADPHEIQYVQPVEIRPVGKPIPAIPYTHGTSYGNSHGSGYGSGHGGGHGSGHGGGHGSGHGGGHGSGHGGGHGDGHGGGHGSGHGGGHGSGHGGGHGSGHGGGHGSGHGGGYGSGHGGGHDSGHGGSHGSGHGSGYGNGHGNSFGNSHGGVFDVSHSNDYGNSYDNGHDNGHSSIIHGDDLYGLTGHGGGGGDGGYLPETGLGGYSGGSSHGYPAPQDLFPYSAASAPSDIYGPPKASSVVHDAPFYGAPQARPSRYDEEQPPVSGYVASQGPSSGYVAPQAPSSGYVAPQAPSSGYVAPQAPSSGYVAPQAPSSGYVASQAPSSGYVASQAPSSGYDTPLDTSSGYVAPKTPLPLSGSLKSSGGSTQAVKHIHIHQHTYKFDASDAIGVGGFGVSGGYDANLIAAKENVDSKAPVLESERNSDYSANSLPEPQDVFILAPSAEYGTGSDGGVDLVRGVREPTRVGQPRDIGCTCVPIEQCPQQLDVGTPFAREDLSAIQDPRNSPSLNGVLSNASHPLLRRRRDTQPPFDQIAVPSQDQLLKQSKELFPETSRLDGDPFAFDPDASQSDTCRVVQPSPYPNIKIVSTDLTVQGADDGPVGPQASNTEPFLAPTPVPVDLSAGQVDASLVRSQREGAVQDVSLQYQDVLRSNPHLRPTPGASCGLYKVCCNLETYQGSSSSPFNSFSDGACGIKNSDGVNGRINQLMQQEGDAEFGEYPWQAAVLKKEGYDNVYVCAGTLIDDRYILTAAHCVKGYEAFELRIRLGEWDVNRDTEFYPYFESDVVAVYVHPDFYSGNLINDIAIIRNVIPVDFILNPHVAPVCLPSHNDFTGQRCWVSGWGKDDFGSGGNYQNILKEVDLVVVSRGVCETALQQTRLGSSYRLHPGMLCAGGQLGKDACKGDGGGPLACESSDGSFQLAGIVSWGIGCGADGVPGVYVNVAHYLDWIYQIIKY
ncbi:uncharacterized protein [Panulirus ornatus]|uniref:uncharacterized protein isoform X2 n=1 Tax=Panulirus ornatus TaxID=150431 RepID=UPI003A8B725E